MSNLTTEQAAALREALLEQLAYLVDEVGALREVIGRVPAAVLEGRPYDGTFSIKENYGRLAAADRAVFLPMVERMQAEDEPRRPALDEAALAARDDWNALPMAELLSRVEAARTALVGALRALPETAWARTGRMGETRHDVYSLARAVIERDTDLLRETGYRLHESRLTDRDEDLPK